MSIKTLDRAGLAGLPILLNYPQDTDGRPTIVIKTHECSDCDNTWSDSWSCACDDECGVCGSSVPAEAAHIDNSLPNWVHALWDLLPEAESEIGDPSFVNQIASTVARDDIHKLTGDRQKKLISSLSEENPEFWQSLNSDTSRKRDITTSLTEAIIASNAA